MAEEKKEIVVPDKIDVKIEEAVVQNSVKDVEEKSSAKVSKESKKQPVDDSREKAYQGSSSSIVPDFQI